LTQNYVDMLNAYFVTPWWPTALHGRIFWK